MGKKQYQGFNSSKDQQTFCVKGQKVNIFGFAGHVVSAATTHLYPYMSCENCYRQYLNEWAWLYSQKTLFIKTDSGPIRPMGQSLLNPDLEFQISGSLTLMYLRIPWRAVKREIAGLHPVASDL